MSCPNAELWSAEYLSDGVPTSPTAGPGWYARRRTAAPDHPSIRILGIRGPFADEEECRRWCRENNPDGVEGTSAEEIIAAQAMAREQAFWNAFLGEG
jgi:hypothetical protein